MITVFTPTYNRAHLLPRLYKSLLAQTNHDFEWIIVDDGSVDNTSELIKSFINDKLIDIKYHYQNNGGKHRAINKGVSLANGELFFIVDSDDELPPESIKVIKTIWEPIKNKDEYAGIVGYISHRNGDIIGHGCKFDILDCNTIDFRYKYKVKGDMAEVTRTSVLKENLFPQNEGELFCPEALIWNRISREYIFRYFNRVIYYRDYLEGGLTDRIVKIRINSPISTITHYSELIEYDIPFIEKAKSATNYWRFWYCLNNNQNYPKIKKKWYFFKPLGFIYHLKDKRSN